MTTETNPPTYKGAVAWMAKNPVAANLLMLFIFAAGILGMLRTKQEVFPAFELDLISVRVPYPGASPKEVEQGIILALEESLRGIDGIKRLNSVASESVAVIAAEIRVDADKDKVLSDIKGAVDRIQSFPEEAERPTVTLIEQKRQVISLIISGDHELSVLHEVAEKAREDLIAHPEISQVEILGVRPLEISIEITRENLEKFGLTLDEVSRQIGGASLEFPIGSIETREGEFLLRLADRRRTGEELKSLILRGNAQGIEIELGEIATITDGYADTDQSRYYNGKPAVTITAFRVANETPSKVADAVKEHKEKLAQQLPDTFTVAAWSDDSEILEARIDLLLRNAQSGFILVFVTLALFLQLRLSFWVAWGIPSSFFVVFATMPSLGISINMITLFALIITLGLVVDDAIVVGENIYKKREEGIPPLQASIEGAQEMAIPVIFSVLTTVAAFSALFFVPGVSGKIFFMIPAVVVTVLMGSLVESLFVLPAHLAHAKERKSWITAPIDLLRGIVSRGLKWFIEVLYTPVLRVALRLRYLVLILAIAVLGGVMSLVVTGVVPFKFFPALEGDFVFASARLPFGSPIEKTLDVRAKMETAAQKVVQENGGELLRGMLTRVGEGMANQQSSQSGGHLVSIDLSLIPSSERTFTAAQFAAAWEKELRAVLTEVESLSFVHSTGPGAGAAVDVQLSMRDINELARASEKLAGILKESPELSSVQNSYSAGKQQLDFKLTPQAKTLNLTGLEIARQLRGAFFGVEALREQRGRNELKIFVRLPKDQRQSINDIEQFPIRTITGAVVPLSYVANFSKNKSPTQIVREDGRPIINVSAELTPGVPSAREILERLDAEIFPALKAEYPGLEIDLVGQQREQAETFASLGQNFLLALFAIYVLLAIPFKSYWQPIIVMSAIPFGFVGAILGHLLLGYEITIISIMGIIALSGVAVNDSLVLIDAINTARDKGEPVFDAVLYAGARRLRPIFLTSFTTFFGLAPMIFETSLQARFLIPMAISLGFGVMFSTFVTLGLVPALYFILEDFLRLFDWVGKKLGLS